MRERYRLYSKWGIRRMSRARLRKVIYELLWKDPKRYASPPSISKWCCKSSAAVDTPWDDVVAFPDYLAFFPAICPCIFAFKHQRIPQLKMFFCLLQISCKRRSGTSVSVASRNLSDNQLSASIRSLLQMNKSVQPSLDFSEQIVMYSGLGVLYTAGCRPSI